jgi:hypothetical protein
MRQVEKGFLVLCGALCLALCISVSVGAFSDTDTENAGESSLSRAAASSGGLEITGDLKISRASDGIVFGDGSKQNRAFPGEGPGSGLDADTLDGFHAAELAALAGKPLPVGSQLKLDLVAIEKTTLDDPAGYTLDGKTVKCSYAIDTYTDGSSGTLHKRPGKITVGNITLSHTIASDATLSAFAIWFNGIKSGAATHRTIALIIYHPRSTNELLHLNCLYAFPVAISYEAQSASTLTEKIELAVEELNITIDSAAEVSTDWRTEIESIGNLYARDINNSGGRVAVSEYFDGSDPTPHKRPGTYSANDMELVDLGAGSARKFLAWQLGTFSRHSLTNWHGSSRIVNAFYCWPSSFSGLALDAEGGIVIKRAIITCEMVERP